MKHISYGVHHMLTLASRQRCMEKINKIALPKFGASAVENGAVLVPVCRVDGVISILYTVRTTSYRNEPGEALFPGGKSDHLESPTKTVLRETFNKIGLESSKIDIWGTGPPLPSHDEKFVVTPVLGSIEKMSMNDIHIKDEELSECFAVPVETLCDPKNQFHTRFKNGIILPVFVADSSKIWGMTAFVIRNSCIFALYIE